MNSEKHFVDKSSADFQCIYDKSGRLVEDKNRNITLAYNLMGLPRHINHTASPYSIDFMYDAAGNKLQKYLHDNHVCPPDRRCTPASPYAIDYIGNFIYEQGELTMIYHPEGMLRPTPRSADNETEFVYDYFIKDYLGNVRVVLTEEDANYSQKFLATMDTRAKRNALWHSGRRVRTQCSHRLIERDNFDNIDETAQELPLGYPVNGSVELNEKIARLSAANGTEIGPSIVLPVRRGDKVSLRTDYFYTEDAPGATYDNLNMLVNEVLLALVASGSNILRLTEGQLTEIITGGGGYSQTLSSFFTSSFDTTDVSKPHAYLVWMLYDNDMKLIPSGSGVQRVTDPNALEELIIEQIPVEADGYLHAYVSNGSASPVTFDNFLVTYIRGKTRQINHYYLYGLSLDGLDHSDEYLNKYTSKELQTGEFDPALSSGLEMFDFHARFYDPQVGRWFTPGPAEQFHNPYLAMGNNPVMYVDPDGEWIGLAIGGAILITNMIKSGIETKNAGSSFLHGFMYSYVTGAATMALTAGVGAAFGAIGSSLSAAGEPFKLTVGQTILKEVGRSAAHGVIGGTMSHYNGGDFKSGFIASAASSGIGSLTHNLNPFLQIGASGLSGGIASELTGGDFSEGFTNGVFISALNHLAHQALNKPTDPPKKGKRYSSPYKKPKQPFIPGPYDGPGSNWANFKAIGSSADNFVQGKDGFENITFLFQKTMSIFLLRLPKVWLPPIPINTSLESDRPIISENR